MSKIEEPKHNPRDEANKPHTPHPGHGKEGRADETDPPLGNGDPDPPLAEPELPAERVIVYGDASATYGSMVAPEVIRPHAGKLDEVLEPVRKSQENDRKKAEKKAEKEDKKEPHKKDHK